MKLSRILALFALVAALPTVSLAASATDQQKFQGKIGKFTSENSFVSNPKRTCVCIDDDKADDERMAGVVLQDVFVGGDGLRRVRVRCFVRRFKSDGSSDVNEACSGNWVLLH